LSGLSESSYRLALEEVVNHSVDRQA